LHMLTRSEAEIWFVFGKLECVCARVFGDGLAVDEFNRDPAVFLEYGLF
jgi:hypothetical protein